MNVTLTNSFHNTQTVVRSRSPDASEAWYQIQATAATSNAPSAKARLRRVERALCGIEGCKCGTVRA